MKKGAGLLYGAVLCLVPFTAHADVIINEFLYDAQGTDIDQEYIELYNDGDSSVDLTKWKINDGSNHTLNVPPKNGGTGSIEIPAKGYALLVDNAVNFIVAHPGIPGTIIDTVLSLTNESGAIALLDESGAVVENVTYSKDQGAAGDGNSLQRHGSTWISAAPTPNVVNATAPISTADSTEQTEPQLTGTQPASPVSRVSVSSYVAPPNPTIFVDAGGDRTVIVGADTEYVGRAYNKKQENIELVRYMWNFGDGTTAEGSSVLHHFDYPGRYAVLLSIAHDRETQASRIVVTAEPANLGFNALGDGGVSIENRAGRDLDLSKWIVRSFGRLFVLPEHSVILSSSSMRISSETLNFFSGSETELAYPNGIIALHANNSSSAQTLPAPTSNVEHTDTTAVAKAPPAYAQAHYVPIKEAVTVEKSIPADKEVLAPEVSSSSAMLAAAADAGQGSSSWWLIAGGLSASLGAAAYAIRRMKRKEWDIVEET